MLTLDNREMAGRDIKVAISNPPNSKERQPSLSQSEKKGYSLRDVPTIRKPLSM